MLFIWDDLKWRLWRIIAKRFNEKPMCSNCGSWNTVRYVHNPRDKHYLEWRIFHVVIIIWNRQANIFIQHFDKIAANGLVHYHRWIFSKTRELDECLRFMFAISNYFLVSALERVHLRTVVDFCSQKGKLLCWMNMATGKYDSWLKLHKYLSCGSLLSISGSNSVRIGAFVTDIFVFLAATDTLSFILFPEKLFRKLSHPIFWDFRLSLRNLTVIWSFSDEINRYRERF